MKISSTELSRVRKWINLAGKVILSLLVGFFIFVNYPYWSTVFYSSYSEFTSENWTKSHKFKRLVIAEDFLQKKSVKNLNRARVIMLLGKPDIDYGHRMGYFLSITTADFMMLSFIFDKNEQVVKAFIHQT